MIVNPDSVCESNSGLIDFYLTSLPRSHGLSRSDNGKQFEPVIRLGVKKPLGEPIELVHGELGTLDKKYLRGVIPEDWLVKYLDGPGNQYVYLSEIEIMPQSSLTLPRPAIAKGRIYFETRRKPYLLLV